MRGHYPPTFGESHTSGFPRFSALSPSFTCARADLSSWRMTSRWSAEMSGRIPMTVRLRTSRRVLASSLSRSPGVEEERLWMKLDAGPAVAAKPIDFMVTGSMRPDVRGVRHSWARTRSSTSRSISEGQTLWARTVGRPSRHQGPRQGSRDKRSKGRNT
jgi:hypothetical protein